jgi:hypothetical protein
MGMEEQIDEQNIINLQREFYKVPEKEIKRLYSEQKKECVPDDFFAPYRATRNLLKRCSTN